MENNRFHPAVDVDLVDYTYPPPMPDERPTPALRNVQFALRWGERALLLGPTGAGKTTLLLSLIGIVPQRTGGRFRGRVVVAGQDTRRTPVAQLATQAGFLFQDPEAQLFQVRVDDEVAFALENLGLPEREISRRVQWALEVVGLWHLRHRPPAYLSGGEKQRLALAAVLAMQPDILILDEPTANLDPVGRKELLTVLQELITEGRTLIIATQETDWGVQLAHSAHVLHEGELVASGSTVKALNTVLLDPVLSPLLPQIAQITGALRQRGVEIPLCWDVHSAGKALRPFLRPPRERERGIRPRGEAEGVIFPQERRKDSPPVPRLTLENVYFVYATGSPALQGVTLTVEPGELLALVGPNGAGKSTLARLCNGLLKPTQGRVLVGPHDTRELSPAQLARWVGYVFQHPDHQIFAATVWEEIAFGPQNLNIPPAEVGQRVEEMLSLFGLHPYREKPPAVLGFGQRRKVALASVLAMQPRILILDEPTGGLDAKAARELMEYVSRYHQAGHTVILITHDMRLVAEWAPRTVVLYEGRILYDGPTRALFQRADILAQARLTPPPVTQLAQELHPWGFPTDVLTVEEFLTTFQQHAHLGPHSGNTQPPSGRQFV